MIISLICGSQHDFNRFPGRNVFPLLGRPIIAYPVLAAQHAKNIEQVFVTTDSPEIIQIARNYGCEVIERPEKLSTPETTLEEVLLHAYHELSKENRGQLQAVVILFANGPTITSDMIDQAIEMLLEDTELDGVMAMTQRNEYNPQYAYGFDSSGNLQLHPNTNPTIDTENDTYFPASILWVLRPHLVENIHKNDITPNTIVDPIKQKIRPFIISGHRDLDYVWQIPSVEEWLRRNGFTQSVTPYKQIANLHQSADDEIVSQLPNIGPSSNKIERRVLITTVPFGAIDRTPLDILEKAQVEYVINPLNRKLQVDELRELAKDFGIIIAGTEPNTRSVMENAPNLRLISRVGIGLDSVDLLAAQEFGIHVSYTPDAPAPAVAELAVGLMLSLLRGIPQSDRNMRHGVWHRIFGRRIGECIIGIIGVGRIGKRVIEHLQGFSPKRILINDIQPDINWSSHYLVEWLDKEIIYREADIISLHVPLTSETQNLITSTELGMMRSATSLINTARGGIINELDLANALTKGTIHAAAVDTFLQEPYSGELTTIENCILTSHMGSMSEDCRCRMELEATQEVLRFLQNKPLRSPVPELEYELRTR